MSDTPAKPDAPRKGHVVARVIIGAARLLIVLALLGAGIYAAYWFRNSTPAAEKTQEVAREEAARLVTIDVVRRADLPVVVRGMGTVMPAREAMITPQVSGAIVSEHDDFAPGGFFRAGEEMLRLERIDYEQVVEQRESDVARAEAALQVELGDQALAREELELLDVDVPEINRDLILRIPQVNRARAEVRSAKAALERARLDLERTRIPAPFDGHVIEREATLGNNVGPGDTLARFVGSHEYWVELTLPVGYLRWIETADGPSEGQSEGSVVRISYDRAWGEDAYREGRIVRRLGELERASKLARVLVSVPDPLAMDEANAGAPRMILGAFVDVEIAGRALANCVVLDRNLVREGDLVWVMGPDDRLVTRSVEVAHRGPREFYITAGLEDGDRVVRTNLTRPVDGMLLRLAEQSASTDEEAVADRGAGAVGG